MVLVAVQGPAWAAVIAAIMALAALVALFVLAGPSRARRGLLTAGLGMVVLVCGLYFGYFLLFPGD
jgi:hypothetical protein